VLVLIFGGVAAALPALAASQGEPPTFGLALPQEPGLPPDVFLDVDAKPLLDRGASDRYSASWSAWNPAAATYNLDVVDPEFWPVNLEGCASTAVRRITGYIFATPPPLTIICQSP
jgi:hypothetical protein